MTVKQVLVKSPWNVTYSGNKNWEHFINDIVGKWNCSFPAVIPKDLNYYELWQKKHGVIRVFQDGNYCDFYKMDPCKDALCVHFLGLPLALAEIFEYRQRPFEEVITVYDQAFFFEHFEEFNIFTESGFHLTDKWFLQHSDENAVAISKKALSFQGPFQDGSENRNIHIVMRYISPTSTCDIQNKK